MAGKVGEAGGKAANEDVLISHSPRRVPAALNHTEKLEKG